MSIKRIIRLFHKYEKPASQKPVTWIEITQAKKEDAIKLKEARMRFEAKKRGEK